jgi:hypothetical protein
MDPSHSPQAKGRIEKLFETLQDRLVKEMRLAGIHRTRGANHFLETRFIPEWGWHFTAPPRNARNAHRRTRPSTRTDAAIRKSFRPTASRTRGTKTETHNKIKTQIPCACRTPLDKVEPNTSIGQKSDISTLR